MIILKALTFYNQAYQTTQVFLLLNYKFKRQIIKVLINPQYPKKNQQANKFLISQQHNLHKNPSFSALIKQLFNSIVILTTNNTQIIIIMQHSFSNSQRRLSQSLLSECINQEKKQSIRQLQRINNSNRKLDLLEQKMNMLLNKDKKITYNKYQNGNSKILKPNDGYNKNIFSLNNAKMAQIQQYLVEGSSNQNQREQQSHDDILLQNSSQDHQKLTSKQRYDYNKYKRLESQPYNYNKVNADRSHNNQRNKIGNKDLKNNQISTKYDKEYQPKAKKDKSYSSLKLFTNKQPKFKNIQNSSSNQLNQKESKLNISDHQKQQDSKFNKIGNKTQFPRFVSKLSQNQKNQDNARTQNILNFRTQISNNNSNYHKPYNIPSQLIIQNSYDLVQITQLQQMMQKSQSIKQKQLAMLHQEIQNLQKKKIQQYRNNVQLEVQLNSLKRFNKKCMELQNVLQDITVDTPEGRIQIVLKESFENQNQRNIFKNILEQKHRLQFQCQDLSNTLKDLQEKQYQISLIRKRQDFELRSLERQFKVHTMKYKRNRNKLFSAGQMKQNKLINGNKLESNKINDSEGKNLQIQPNQKLKKRQQSSTKTLKKHYKRHSYAELDEKIKYQKVEKCIKDNQKAMKKSLSQRKIPKRVESSTNTKNRHLKASCQSHCPTDRILYDMVDELDKLKNIVNHQIVKTRSNSRKTINLKSLQMQNIANANKNQKGYFR